MPNNQIIIQIKEGKVKVSQQKPINFEDFLTALQTAILMAMTTIRSAAPPAAHAECTNQLYDTYNLAASNLLRLFAPDLELRPHLTTQAILEAENKIIFENRAPKLKVN